MLMPVLFFRGHPFATTHVQSFFLINGPKADFHSHDSRDYFPMPETVLLFAGAPCSLILPIPEANVALELLNSMPQRAFNLIRSSGFNGCDLVRLESDVHRPSFKDWGLGYAYANELDL